MMFASFDDAIAYLEAQRERMREAEAQTLADWPWRERVAYLARLEGRGATARAADLRARCMRRRGLGG